MLSSLTHREELIVEWDKTLQTLTRVLARQVYNLNLQDLPLDRLADQKNKRRRVGVPASTNIWHQSSQQEALVATSSKVDDLVGPARPQHQQMRQLIPGTPVLNRSYSEGSLATPYRKSRARRRIKAGQVQQLPANVENSISRLLATHLNHLSVSMETLNISRVSQSGESAAVRRALSLDSIRPGVGGKSEDNESYRESRSPSPTASSGIEGKFILFLLILIFFKFIYLISDNFNF